MTDGELAVKNAVELKEAKILLEIYAARLANKSDKEIVDELISKLSDKD